MCDPQDGRSQRPCQHPPAPNSACTVVPGREPLNRVHALRGRCSGPSWKLEHLSTSDLEPKTWEVPSAQSMKVGPVAGGTDSLLAFEMPEQCDP